MFGFEFLRVNDKRRGSNSVIRVIEDVRPCSIKDLIWKFVMDNEKGDVLKLMVGLWFDHNC